MHSDRNTDAEGQSTSEQEAIGLLRAALKEGGDWAEALLRAMAVWTTAEEDYRGQHRCYFIGGEAFDWLALAERLCRAVDGLVPERGKENLLFTGRLPASIDEHRFKDLMGVDKYRAHLNFLYGVTVEEALQLATEHEVQKRHLSNGNCYQEDFSEEAFATVYHAPKSALLQQFREERGYRARRSMGMTEHKEFTYWLFKRRLNNSDPAKVASDTRKGLTQLQKMMPASQLGPDHLTLAGPMPSPKDRLFATIP